MTHPRTAQRGAALLVVMVAVAVLTALATDLAYDTRVSLHIAANARDELKATYLAKGGVALSRLVLAAQQDVETAMQGLNVAAGGVTGGQPMPAIKPQLWRMIPVDSDLAGRLFGGPGGDAGAPPVTAAALAAGAHEGAAVAGQGFTTDVQDEGAKVNVQLDGLGTSVVLALQVQALNQLICDARWDALFDRDDANGQRVSRADLVAYLRDWVDDDTPSSALAAAFPAGNCSMVLGAGQNPFEVSYQDENYPYDRGEDRYRAKNARFDSLAELSMVAGVSDAFLAAFGDHLTVYMPRDAKPNLNGPDHLRSAALIAATPDQPALRDPLFAERLQKAILERTFGGILALSTQDFAAIVEALGVPVDRSKVAPQGGAQTPFDDRSSVFKILSRGRAGAVEKTIEAVLQYPKRGPGLAAAAPNPNDAMGKLVRWHEE